MSSKPRHVLEDPEYHVKWDPDTLETLRDENGKPIADDPHCDWCWERWPCRAARRRGVKA